MKHSSIRVLLSMVVVFDLEPKEIIYTHQPEGFSIPGKENHVCVLKMSLYELKRSTRA